jgi:hypothetical protein
VQQIQMGNSVIDAIAIKEMQSAIVLGEHDTAAGV